MPALGLVSRVSPVHTAVCNCTRDEGGPFEVGNQVLITSHRKLLWSKATVVNVAEKPEQESGRLHIVAAKIAATILSVSVIHHSCKCLRANCVASDTRIFAYTISHSVTLARPSRLVAGFLNLIS